MRCALALLFATVHGMTVQLKGLRTQVDPHWERGQRPQAQIVVLRRLEGICLRAISKSVLDGLKE